MARRELTTAELKAIRPKMGRKIITTMQAELMEKGTAQQESFLDDPSMIENSMAELPNYRRPTVAEMMARHNRNVEERRSEFASMGRTGKELFGPLPPIPFKAPVRIMDTSSESEPESDKENDSIVIVEEKEEDETTPIAPSQRSVGHRNATPLDAETVEKSLNASIPSTPPARPQPAQRSEFRRPDLPLREKKEMPPRHSTPKRATSHRNSLGEAFNNISMIANNSLLAPPPAARSTLSTTAGSAKSRKESIEEEEEDEQIVERGEEERKGAAANATYDVNPRDEGRNEEGGEEKEAEQMDAAANGTFVIDRSARQETGGNATFNVDRREEEEKEEEAEVQVAVAAVTMRRQSMPSDVTMASILEEKEEEKEKRDDREEEEEESMEIEDVEMRSVSNTPQRPAPRVGKRSSFEHPLTLDASPMAVVLARRSSGLRETMIRPKISMQSMQSGKERKSTDSVGSIQFEDISHQNISTGSGSSAYEDPTTPERTPRTDRLYRKSILARQQRQSQQHRLEMVEENSMHDEEEEEEEEDEIIPQRKVARFGREAVTPRSDTVSSSSTPAKLPRLSQKLQSSVDRLSQPRHRVEDHPCAKLHSPSRPQYAMTSPSPVRRYAVNITRNTTIGGYTPNQRIDTTMMEDTAGNAKSGMAPRIKMMPRRMRNVNPVLNLTDDIEDERRQNQTQAETISTQNETRAKATPITSPTTHTHNATSTTSHASNTSHAATAHNDMDDVFNDSHSDGGLPDANQSMQSTVGVSHNDTTDIFVRPMDPPTPTRVSGVRRSNAANGVRKSLLSDTTSDAGEDLDRLSRRASQISIVDEDADMGGAAHAARAASSSSSIGMPTTPKTPFRRFVNRDADLFSTDTPGIDRTFNNTTEEEEWVDNVDSRVWRGDVSTASDENEVESMEDSQIAIVEEDDYSNERVLAPRKLIQPTASPGVRRSTRTRIKPVRGWLGEKAEYEYSPTSGARRLVGVNEVVIKDKLFCKTGTADIQKAVEQKKKTERQRRIANQKRKGQKASMLSDGELSE